MTSDEVRRPVGMTLREITFDRAAEFDRSVRRECEATLDRAESRFERKYMSQIGLYRFYGAEFYGVFDGEMVSLHIASFGKSPRKNAWGRYVNHYLAYTRPGARGMGYASHGELDLQAQAAERGYDRLKTLCQSWLGVLYHERLRDQMWGTNEKGEIVIDSPLHDGPWPEGVPIKARKWCATGAEITADELAAVITDPAGRFRATPAEAARVIEKRRWRREQGFEPADPASGPPDHPGALGHSATPPGEARRAGW